LSASESLIMARVLSGISRGDQSDYIRQTLVDLEAQAMVEKNAIEALKRQAAKPIQLPSPDELMEVAYNLEKLALADPALGREELRKMFDQGHIVLLPQPDGYYLAKSKIFPLVPLLDPRYANAPSGEDGAWYGVSRAGAICGLKQLIRKQIRFEMRRAA
jgi:hypothetical protein